MNIIDQIDAATGCQQCQRPLGDSVSSDFCSPSCQAAWHAHRSTPIDNYREPTDLAAHVTNLVELHSPDTTPRRDAQRPQRPRPPIVPNPVRFRALWHHLYNPGMVTVDIQVGTEQVQIEVDRDVFARRVHAFHAATTHIPNWLNTGMTLADAVELALLHSGVIGRGLSGHTVHMAILDETHDWQPDVIVAAERRGGYIHLVPIGLTDEQRHRIAEHNRRVLDDVAAAMQQTATAMADCFQRATAGLPQALEQLRQAIQPNDRLASPANAMQRALEARRTRNTGPTATPRAPRRIDPRRNR